MSTSQHTAEVVVKGKTDGVSQKLKEVADGTEKVKRAADAAGASQEKWGDKLDRIDKKMSNFTSRINQVTGILGAGGLLSMVQGVAGAMGEMADRAGQITIANQALAISIGAARQATMGLVGDYDLTVAANKAVTLGVVKTDAEFAKLAATAAKLGQAMGQGAGQSVDDLTTALGRQSVMILDNLGISLKLEEAYDIYAARLGKTAAALTDAEKKQGFMTVALERADAAAAKANISLDTQAAKIQRLSTDWGNLKDSLATGFTSAMVGVTDAIDGALTAATSLHGELASPVTKEYEDQLFRITDQLNGANSATLAWLSTTTLTGEEMVRQAAAGYSEKIIGLRREEFLAQRAANDEMRKSVALEQERTAKSAIALELDKKKHKPKSKKVKEEAEVIALDRFADQTFGIDATAAIQTEVVTNAIANDIVVREDRIMVIERELEIAQMQLDAGMIEAEEVEKIAQRKYAAEVSLLDLEVQAADTREGIYAAEDKRRRRAAQEIQRTTIATQAIEVKALKEKQAMYQSYGSAVGNAIGAVTMAAMEGADGQDHAAVRVIAAVGKQIRNQLIMTAIQETVLAVASAASFNFVGAAAHGTAAGIATGGAVLVGSIAGVANAFVPPKSSDSVNGGGGMDSPKGETSGRGRDSQTRGDGDSDGVPTSYYDGGLYSKRPDRVPQAANGRGDTFNITALGGTTEQVYLALQRGLDGTKRSMGGVK